MQSQTNHAANKQSNSDLSFLVLPSERLISYNNINSKVELLLNIRCEDYVLNNKKNKIAVIVSKSVKSYDISNGLNQNSEPIFQSFFPKKVQGLSFDHNDKIIVSDKFGDIYQATPQNPVYLNSNLGIPTFLHHIHNHKNNKEYIILGDDYCKIKVYNYKNMHQITAIWYIPNSVPLDIIQVDQQRFIILVKHQDKENLKHTYKLYQFSIENLDEGDFKGHLVYSDVEEKLNSSEYCPCAVTYSQKTKSLYFLKLYDDRIEVARFQSDAQTNGHFKQITKYTQKLPQVLKQGNSIDGQLVCQGKDNQQQYLLICYGKYFNIQDLKESKDSAKQIQWKIFQNQSTKFYKLNNQQFLIKWKLN